MKALPKRKGNLNAAMSKTEAASLNESPSEKEGKCGTGSRNPASRECLNESPSEKEGKCKSSA